MLRRTSSRSDAHSFTRAVKSPSREVQWLKLRVSSDEQRARGDTSVSSPAANEGEAFQPRERGERSHVLYRSAARQNQRMQSGTVFQWFEYDQRSQPEEFELLERDEPAKSREIGDTVEFAERQYAQADDLGKLRDVPEIQPRKAELGQAGTARERREVSHRAPLQVEPSQIGAGRERAQISEVRVQRVGAKMQHRQRPRLRRGFKARYPPFKWCVTDGLTRRDAELAQADHGRENCIEVVLLNVSEARTYRRNEKPSAVLSNEVDDIAC